MNPSEWWDQYGVKTRGGTFQFDADGLLFGPRPIGASPSGTAAAMVVFTPSDATKGGAYVTKFIAEMDVTLVAQLRTPKGNNWESFWFVSQYLYNADFTKVMNGFVPKPLGFQVETCSSSIEETFLTTMGSPNFPVGQKYKFKIQLIGQELTMWKDGVQFFKKTYDGAKTCGSNEKGTVECQLNSHAGAIAIYNEDALVRVNNFHLTRLP